MAQNPGDIEKWTHKDWKYQRFCDEGNLVVWRRDLSSDHNHRLDVLQMWVNGEYVGREKTWGARVLVLTEMYREHCQ